jgi:hypothetical protein
MQPGVREIKRLVSRERKKFFCDRCSHLKKLTDIAPHLAGQDRVGETEMI